MMTDPTSATTDNTSKYSSNATNVIRNGVDIDSIPQTRDRISVRSRSLSISADTMALTSLLKNADTLWTDIELFQPCFPLPTNRNKDCNRGSACKRSVHDSKSIYIDTDDDNNNDEFPFMSQRTPSNHTISVRRLRRRMVDLHSTISRVLEISET
jgi:hypothetical protein